MTCHSCLHEDSVARPVGKAETPRDTREDRVYAASVCMRAGRYQKSMSEVMQYAALYRIKVGGGQPNCLTAKLPKGGDGR